MIGKRLGGKRRSSDRLEQHPKRELPSLLPLETEIQRQRLPAHSQLLRIEAVQLMSAEIPGEQRVQFHALAGAN